MPLIGNALMGAADFISDFRTGLIATNRTEDNAAGATWWLESMWDEVETMYAPETQQRILERVRLGPPRAA